MAERKRKDIADELESKAQKKALNDNMMKQSDAIIQASAAFSKIVEGLDKANGSNELQDTVAKMDDRITKQSNQIASLFEKQSSSHDELMNFMKQISEKLAKN